MKKVMSFNGVVGVIFLLFGAIYIINSLVSITGLAIIEHADKTPSAFAGLYFLFAGAFILSLNKKRKRGQAAMEFLMTYGWAILAAIIAIGVLAYFGVFNPGRLASSSAVVNAPFNVDSFSIVSDQGPAGATTGCNSQLSDCFNMQITQNSGKSVTLAGAKVTLTNGGTGACTNRTMTGLPGLWASGTSMIINNFSCGTLEGGAASISIFNSGTTMAGTIEIKYVPAGSSLIQTSTGNIRGVAQ